MRWTWDPAAGAIYLYLAEDRGPVATVALDHDVPADVMLDIDTGTGQLAGIEILISDGGSTFVKLRDLLADSPEILGG